MKQKFCIYYYNYGKIINKDVERVITDLEKKYEINESGRSESLVCRIIDGYGKNIAVTNAFVLEVSQYLTKIRMNFEIYWSGENKMVVNFVNT